MTDNRAVILVGHSLGVYSVAFSADADLLASAGDDQRIRLWDSSSRAQVGTLAGHTDRIRSLAFRAEQALRDNGTPEPNLASASDDETIRLWHTSTGVELGQLTRHDGIIYSVAFSPNGLLLASAGADKIIRLWDTEGRGEIGQLVGHTGSVTSVTFSPDGTLLASGGIDQTVRLWQVAEQRELGQQQGRLAVIYSVAFSPDGQLVASGSADGRVRLWAIYEANDIRVLAGHTEQINSIAFSADGRYVASGSKDGTVRLWDVESGQELDRLDGLGKAVLSIAYGWEHLAATSWDGIVQLWQPDGEITVDAARVESLWQPPAEEIAVRDKLREAWQRRSEAASKALRAREERREAGQANGSWFSRESAGERPAQSRGDFWQSIGALFNDNPRHYANPFALAGRQTPVTYGLLGLLVLGFIITELMGGSNDARTLLNLGANFGPAVIEDGQVWRFLTAMFLHSGFLHLASNAFGLFIFGLEMERAYNSVRFGVIYILAGLFGSLLSFTVSGLETFSVGASGAVFGVIGVNLAFYLFFRPVLGEVGRQRLTGVLIYGGANLVLGFTNLRIDNMAHVGGLLAGLALGYALAPRHVRGSTADWGSLMYRWWVVALAMLMLVGGTVLAVQMWQYR